MMLPLQNRGKSWSSIAAEEPRAVLLECAYTNGNNGRSLLFRDPVRVIQVRQPEQVTSGFAKVEAALEQGLYVAGFVAYEAGYSFEPCLANLGHGPSDGPPLLWFGCYRKPDIRDEVGPSNAHVQWSGRLAPSYSLSPETYAEKVEAIRNLIAAGETYQANLTMDVRWDANEDPAAMYERLKDGQPVSYAALLHPERDWHLISLSPELFFARNGDQIVTRPMKGTVAPGLDMDEVRANAAWLRGDEKNRAENVMIVDLLRNDLGRICQMGSVNASRLFEVERLPTVLQMTSTVEGRLKEGVGYTDIFRALFPCGSIVGAPKIQTMRRLHELEGRRRGIYTGAIGYISPDGVAEFSVAIRTISLRSGSARLGVGSGIVYDSDPVSEYEECKTKTMFVFHQPKDEFQLIETLLFKDGAYFLLEEHLERISHSAEYFEFAFDPARVRDALEEAVQKSETQGLTRVRLLLDRRGKITWTATRSEAASPQAAVTLLLAEEKTNPMDRFLRHKTTVRDRYDNVLAAAVKEGYTDVLFCNTRDEVTEGAIHNVIVSMGGRWFTPPLRCGLLPGTFRSRLLKEGRVEERMMHVSDLIQAEAVCLCNSVRGLRPVAGIDELTDGNRKCIWHRSGNSD